MKIRDLKYLLAYLIPISAFIGLKYLSFWSYSTIVLSFVIIPILEFFIPPNPSNDEFNVEKIKAQNRFFDLLLYLNIPILYLLIFQTIFKVQSGVETWEAVGLFFNLGIVMATAGINVGHEIGHREGNYNKIAAALLLMPSLYGHFTIEHNYGHHKWVATPGDPATAKYNQSIYSFIVSAVSGVYISAWHIAFKSMEKKALPKWHYLNELIWITLAQIMLFSIYYMIGGVSILLFCMGTAIVSFSLLETIDYVEHYGLTRKLLPSGKYERVSVQHSWNSDHELGRIFLYELTRHADHHLFANRPYQVLRHQNESPQLPLGYPASIIMALLPPVWFRVMNPKVNSYQN